MAKLGVYQNSETPEPIVTIFGIGDCVGDITRTPKFKRSPQWGVPANGWHITLAWFLFLVFLWPKFFARFPRQNRKNDFDAAWFI